MSHLTVRAPLTGQAGQVPDTEQLLTNANSFPSPRRAQGC
jgi:hypothetical protein